MLPVTSFAKNVKNATTKADPYGMTNKGTGKGNSKSKRNGNGRSSDFGEG
jgi:hypothetical protein